MTNILLLGSPTRPICCASPFFAATATASPTSRHLRGVIISCMPVSTQLFRAMPYKPKDVSWRGTLAGSSQSHSKKAGHPHTHTQGKEAGPGEVVATLNWSGGGLSQPFFLCLSPFGLLVRLLYSLFLQLGSIY